MLSGVLLLCSGGLMAETSTQCTNGKASLSQDFEGGRFASCYVKSGGEFALTLQPENRPINPSPWYAFKIDVTDATALTIELNYAVGKHRYRPKLSRDFNSWQALQPESVQVSDDGKQAQLSLTLKSGEYWLSAQPIISNQNYIDWMQGLTYNRPAVSVVEYGQSVQQRPLSAITSFANDKRPLLVLLGRQHPPEVTGAIAMRHFVESLLSDSALANRFRDNINVLIIPNMNPDGVALGNWRHNANGVDLNRDWGPFTQPETRKTIDFIEQFSVDKSMWMMIDFHSTREDIFYTQPAGVPTRFPGLVATWLNQLATLNSAIQFQAKPGLSPDKPTSKSYFYATYQVPAITYEIGDNTEQQTIIKSSEDAAIIFMQLLLDNIAADPGKP